MDLSVHSKDVKIRTIFEDAEYFSKGYSYKLLPITFEAVNETIIHIEHNYCHCKPPEVQDSKEKSHNSTINEDVEERNYKKRKLKTLAMDNSSTTTGCETEDGESVENSGPVSKCGEFTQNSKVDDDSGASVQPLDLSLPLIQEQKTDKTLTENQSNIPKIKSDTKNSPDKKQLNLHESNKENVTSPSRKIEVTISRPGQKGYYEPCEVFLNDLAKISPDLIKNDCHEIEIIDRTRGEDFQHEANRTYYIISESTWRMFESSTERIILTNDLNIGQPVQNSEKYDKPRYLIFDQYSLTESLTNICESKGGSFEYTCLEEPKEQPKVQDYEMRESVESCTEDGSDRGGYYSKSGVNSERRSGSPDDGHRDTEIQLERTEKISDDCAISLGNENYAGTTSLENSDNKTERADEGCNDEEVRQIPNDGDSSQLKNESEICDRNSSTVSVGSVERNLVLSEPIIPPVECKDIGDGCNSGSSYIEEPTTLKRGSVDEGKNASDTGSVQTESLPRSGRRGTKRVRASTENQCAISRKRKKSNSSADAKDTINDDKVQKHPENAEGKREEDAEKDRRPSGRGRPARDRGVTKAGEGSAKHSPESPAGEEDAVKVRGAKGKSRGTKSNVVRTDMKTRSSKEVSVLRNGKQRSSSSAKAGRGSRDEVGSKVSTSKSERAKDIPRTVGRGRAKKSAKPEESKKICLRRRT